MHKLLVSVYLILFSIGVLSAQEHPAERTLTYTGSSTIGNFIGDALPVYGKTSFKLNTRPESAGGELAILEGRTDLAGIARLPNAETLGKGVASTLIGWDAIAIIVHPDNPIQNLTQSQLKLVFTGKVQNWRTFGGPDLIINPYIVGVESATRKVCRSVILGESDYENCQVVSPDVDILDKVSHDPGGIGHISFSFLNAGASIKAISVNGQSLSLTNTHYPITRPLYLLWWPGRQDVMRFVDWVTSSGGQRVIMQRFIGLREGSSQLTSRKGTLVVYTETYTVEDGGVYYYPHRAYEILDLDRKPVMQVANHLSDNDENPSLVELVEGRYIVRALGENGEWLDIFTTIESDKITKIFQEGRTSDVRKKLGKNEKLTSIESDGPSAQNQLLNPYGDFRVRAEQDDLGSAHRFRGRFRIRVGMNAQVSPTSKFDLRFVSTTDPNDPNSSHVNLDGGFNQIRLAIDRAYFHLHPDKFPFLEWWIGKFSNPFLSSGIYSEVVWDDDIQPEGTAVSFTRNFLKKSAKINLTSGYYLLSQFKSGSRKNWLNATQVSANWQLTEDVDLTLAGSMFYFANIKGLEILTPVLDKNEGNSTIQRTLIEAGDTLVTEHYKTNFYLFDNFALLTFSKLPRPLLFKLQSVYNFGAFENHWAFIAGVSYGDLKEKDRWKMYYQYHKIEQDAIFTPFAQDDALHRTNSTGHVFGVAYAFHKKLSLHAWGILSSPLDRVGDLSRFRLDLNVKF